MAPRMRLASLSCRAPLLALALGLAAAPPAFAQFAQYTPPGGVADEPGTRKENMEKAIEAARWHLGPLRVEPWFGLREIGYVDDAAPQADGTGGQDGQFTATGGAGLKTYLPMGPKVVLAAHFLPEYVWAEEEEMRRTTGRFGAGFFGFFNRLTVEATATRTEQLAVVTPEVLRRTDSRADQAAGSLELNVLRSLYVFAGSTLTRVENQVDAADDPQLALLSRLDREEQVTRAGLRLKTRRGWRIGAGFERSDVDFEREAGEGPSSADRSNSGTAPVLELVRVEGKIEAAVDVAWRSLEPKGDAPFVPFDGVTGSLRLGWGSGGRLTPAVYAARNLVYALDPDYSYLESDRYGLSLALRLGHRTQLVAFAETGTDDYQPTDLAPPRSDDQLAYGITAALDLGRSLRFSFGWSREEYDSNVAAGDRDLTVLRGGVTLGRGVSPWY